MTVPRVTGGAVNRLWDLVREDNAPLGLLLDGRYRVTRRIAAGGMADVFLADDMRLGRPVAIKCPGLAGVRWADRFEAEARTLGRIDHPGIVPLHDLGTLPDGRLYYTMKFVAGFTLQAMIEEKSDRGKLLNALIKTCDIVQHAHERGVVHRDLKPANIMVDGKDHVFVLDWGVAKVIDEGRHSIPPSIPARPGRTSAGMILGTPEYMAPEQARGRLGRIDARTDVYALGAILHEILTGRPPGSKGPQDFPSATPPRLEAVCRRALQTNPDLRYSGAAAMADDLRREVHPRRKRRPHWVGAAAILLTALGVLTLRRGNEEALRDLSGLWGELITARQGYYQASKDPAMTRREIEAVLRKLDEFSERHPGLADGYYVRGQARCLLGDAEGAASDMKKAVAMAPDLGSAWAWLGRVRLRQYLATAQGDPDSEDDRRAAADSQLEAAKEAIRKSRQVRVHYPGAAGPARDERIVQRLAEVAEVAYVLGDRPKSRTLLEELHRADPSESYCLGLGLLSETDPERIPWFTEALRIMPHCADAHYGRGAAKLRLGDAAGAQKDFDRVLQIDPRHVWAWVNRGVVQFMQGRLKEAADDCTEAIRVSPSNALAWSNRAGIRWTTGDLSGALADFSESLRCNPRSQKTCYLRAELRFQMDDLSGAISDATEAIRIRPLAANLSHVLRGRLHEERGDLESAFADYSRAIELAPRSPDGYLYRGLAYETLAEREGAERKGRLRAAEADLRGALDFAPGTLCLRRDVVEDHLGRVVLKLSSAEGE